MYLEDFRTVVLGDTLGLSAINFAVVTILLRNPLPLPLLGLIGCIFVGAGAMLLFHLSCRGPWAGYPGTEGTSLVGKLHLIYYWVQMTVAASGLWMIVLMISGRIPWSIEAIVWLCGGLFYLVTLATDIQTGRFAASGLYGLKTKRAMNQ